MVNPCKLRKLKLKSKVENMEMLKHSMAAADNVHARINYRANEANRCACYGGIVAAWSKGHIECAYSRYAGLGADLKPYQYRRGTRVYYN